MKTQFPPQVVLVVLRILITYVLGFCVVSAVWLVLSSWLFLWFLICGLVQV